MFVDILRRPISSVYPPANNTKNLSFSSSQSFEGNPSKNSSFFQISGTHDLKAVSPDGDVLYLNGKKAQKSGFWSYFTDNVVNFLKI